MNYDYLYKLGLNQALLKEFETNYKGLYLGRVTVEHKGSYRVATDEAEILARVSGKFMFQALDRTDYPAVGDWVGLDRETDEQGEAVIHGILQRKSKFSRKMAGNKPEEQIVAANIDTVFICMALNKDFNLRRLERYLSQAWDSGAAPVVLLTKADLCDELDRIVGEASETAVGVDLITVSSVSGYGMDALKALIVPGRTYAFIGSSGVGKSTVVNCLTGENRLETQMVRLDDDKGRHTTTHRELIVLPSGGILIDTPGMRELQLLDVSDSIDGSFSDIAEIACRCKFTDCTHQDEPGCAVKAAIEAGLLSEQRFESYLKLKKEAAFIERKMNRSAALEYKEMMKRRNKEFKNRNKR